MKKALSHTSGFSDILVSVGGRSVSKRFLGSIAICPLMLSLIAWSPTPPNFVVMDPAKRSDAWALERADIDCKAVVRSKKLGLSLAAQI